MWQREFNLGKYCVWGYLVPETESDNPASVMPVELPVQTHSCNLAEVVMPGCEYPDTDALLTSLRDVAIGIRTADCVPVLLYSEDTGMVAAIHAGWKGTLGRLPGKAVEYLVARGAGPTRIKAVIGPCICGDCYEVSEDLADNFRRKGFSDCIYYPTAPAPLTGPDPLTGKETTSQTGQETDPTRPHLDLAKANTQTLTQTAIPKENIHQTHLCTRHTEVDTQRFPSWRRQPGTPLRLITYIRLLPHQS